MELNKIYQGDCLEVLATFPSESIDCVVTSPPYDNLRSYNGFVFDYEKTLVELYRVIKKGGVVVWVVGDATVNGSETGTSFKQALYAKIVGFNLHDTMIYEKNGMASPPDTNRYYQKFEYMFVLSKGKPKTINLISDRKNKQPPNENKRSHKRNPLTGKLEYGKKITAKEYGIRFNIWIYNTGGKVADLGVDHPALFPEQLVKDHIVSWTNKNDIVLDPFMGSGTTGKVCKQLNRNYIGIEISEDYVKMAEERIAKTHCQEQFEL